MNNNHLVSHGTVAGYGVPLLALAKLIVAALLLSTAAVTQETRSSARPQASPVAFAPPITPVEAIAVPDFVMPVGDQLAGD